MPKKKESIWGSGKRDVARRTVCPLILTHQLGLDTTEPAKALPKKKLAKYFDQKLKTASFPQINWLKNWKIPKREIVVLAAKTVLAILARSSFLK